jgi:HD-GYP domain-containing protein (c-di-GMP phosphodiesterase class II)
MMRRDMAINLGNLMLSLSEISDMANPLIAQHQQRVAFIALELARAGGASRRYTEDIFAAALVHDIGALSVEEKAAIHNFESLDPEPHCIRGAILLANTPWLKSIAPVVRYHHTLRENRRQPLPEPVSFAASLILLADYVERLIDRNRYILHQHHGIIEQIRALKPKIVEGRVVDLFLEICRREEFWLDLVSPRLYPNLLHEGPYRDTEIGIKELASVTALFRNLIDFKSSFTATHTAGVAACAGKMAELFGYTEVEVELLKIAANMHDIGKMVIPNRILEKPDRLTAEEYAVIQSHTYYTYYLIKSIGGLHQIALWAAYHHEKLDGSGYPFHCRAGEIDNGARIVMVADIFTAISEDRPYRKGMTKNETYRILAEQVRQNLIDSQMVDLLFDHYEAINAFVKLHQEQSAQFYERQFLNQWGLTPEAGILEADSCSGMGDSSRELGLGSQQPKI